MVWPGAAHNRFEHCLGPPSTDPSACFLPIQRSPQVLPIWPVVWSNTLRISSQNLASRTGMSNVFNLPVYAMISGTALFPMCGMAGSFQLHCGSHRIQYFHFRAVLTGQLSPGRHWHHEDASEMMFDDLVAKNNIDLPKNDIRFIKALIAGDPDSCSYALQGCYHLRPFHAIFSETTTPRRNRFCLTSLQTRGTVSTSTSEHPLHSRITPLISPPGSITLPVIQRSQVTLHHRSARIGLLLRYIFRPRH